MNRGELGAIIGARVVLAIAVVVLLVVGLWPGFPVPEVPLAAGLVVFVVSVVLWFRTRRALKVALEARVQAEHDEGGQ